MKILKTAKSEEEITVFNSTSSNIQDITTVLKVFQKAEEKIGRL